MNAPEPQQQAECECPAGTCQPERNEGCYCWRSRQYIPPGYFQEPTA